MSLSADYLVYPHRQRGYDHDIYAWSNMHERRQPHWPGSKSVAVWLCVSLEWFPITPGGAFTAPGHMVTPYPDYRHYTARDYGNRIGAWRMLDALDAAGVRASFAVNATSAERYPQLIDAIAAGGHEIIAHSTDMNGTIDSSLTEAEERRLIHDAITRLANATGKAPRGWLSIARQQSWRTPDILRELGIAYCCDWVNDELPYRLTNGLINLPLNHELSDRQIITVQQQSAESWRQSLCDAFDWLAAEARTHDGARMLPIHLTPYIMGLPYRIGELEALLDVLADRAEAWFAPGAEIVDAWQTGQL